MIPKAKGPDLAIVLPDFSGGGAERSMLDLAGGLAKRGLSVQIVSALSRGELIAEIPEGVSRVNLGAIGRGTGMVLATGLLGLAWYLRCVRPRTVLSALTRTSIGVLLARRVSGVSVRVVVSEQNSSQNLRGRLIPILVRNLYPQADLLVGISHGVTEDLARLTGLRPGRLAMIPNGIDLERVDRLSHDESFLPWERDGTPLVLGAGRLVPQKDFPTLIQAFDRLRRLRPCRLILLGEGQERARLRAMVRKLGIENDVYLPGFVPNPFAYMRRASVFALSSAWEGLGLVLIEALACGLGIVSTDCKWGPREILEGGRFGSLVPVGDSDALAEALSVALDTTADPAPLRQRARYFSLNRICDSWMSVL